MIAEFLWLELEALLLSRRCCESWDYGDKVSVVVFVDIDSALIGQFSVRSESILWENRSKTLFSLYSCLGAFFKRCSVRNIPCLGSMFFWTPLPYVKKTLRFDLRGGDHSYWNVWRDCWQLPSFLLPLQTRESLRASMIGLKNLDSTWLKRVTHGGVNSVSWWFPRYSW